MVLGSFWRPDVDFGYPNSAVQRYFKSDPTTPFSGPGPDPAGPNPTSAPPKKRKRTGKQMKSKGTKRKGKKDMQRKGSKEKMKEWLRFHFNPIPF